MLRGGQTQPGARGLRRSRGSQGPRLTSIPHGKLKAMDRDGVYAEVIFPELAGAKIVSPALMGNDWKEVFQGYNNAMARLRRARSGAPA